MKATLGDFIAGALGGILCALIAVQCVGCSFSVDGDRALAPDASTPSVDAAPRFVVLSQTDDGVIEPTVGARCELANGSTGDQAWLRVFDLPAEGVTGAFALTEVHLRESYARDARGVSIRIGTYAGAMGGTSIAMNQITWLVTSTIDMPDAGGPFDVILGGSMPAVTVPAGSRLAIGVFAPSYQAQPGGGALRLGFTIAPERAPSYFASSACGVATQSTQAMGSPGHLVLDVSGWDSSSTSGVLGTDARSARENQIGAHE